MALDFDEQYCVGELLINNGLVEQEISCYRSGNLGSFEGYYNNTEENIYWYSDGKLKEESLVFNEKYRGNFSFDDKGLLTTAIIENDYFMILNEMKSHLRYCQLLNSTCFKNINTANYTFLSGEGVDNHFIKALAESNGLSGTNKLSLDNCSFDLKNYLLIGQLENLKTLSVKDQRIGISHILKKVKVSRPELLITFNKHELTTY